MCHYLSQSISYTHCTHPVKHITARTKWDHCIRAKTFGRKCADVSAARGLNDRVLVFGAVRKIGECPACETAEKLRRRGRGL
jgi:hypothetical protein